MCKAAFANKGLQNSWENRVLSKTTAEEAAAPAGVGSRNGTHVESVTPAVTAALAGGFLHRQGGEVVMAGKENGDKSFRKP